MTKRIHFRIIFFLAIVTLLSVIGKSISIDRISSHLFLNSLMFTEFIKDNGYFPKSEQELIDKGYMKIVLSNGNQQYKYSSRGNDFWYDLNEFDSYRYYYGTSISDLEYNNGVVYQKKSNKPFLFIDGPYSSSWKKKTYNDVTIKIYEAITNASHSSLNSKN